MAHGGRRPGSGRKKGTVGPQRRAKKEFAQRIAAAGVTPLEVMSDAMRYYHQDAYAGEQVNQTSLLAAVQIAEKVAPYVHPKMATIAVQPESERTT